MHNDTFNVSFPIDMIKREERIVTGVATADNIDKSGDIIEFDASIKAFEGWRGNIREMHAPVAVGKAVSYEPVNLVIDGKMYKGMQISAYISKGAQSTWEKVLDGTLAAFSVGGRVLERSSDEDLTEETGKSISRITNYELGEISLVDNPANPAAVVELVKSNDDGQLYYALDRTDHQSDDVDLLKNENGANVLSMNDNSVTNDVDVLDAFSIEEKVSLLRRFVNWLANEEDADINSASDDLGKTEESSVEESEGEIEMDINTMKEAFGTVIEEKLPLMKEELMSDIVSYIDDKIETAQKSVEVEEAAAEEVVAKAEAEAEVESKTEEFDSMVVKFREELDAALATVEEQKSALSEATAKIEQIESSGAIKKSVESDESVDEEETVVKEAETSFWGNFYLPNDLIKSLGYDS
jgi:hypothetical protein